MFLELVPVPKRDVAYVTNTAQATLNLLNVNTGANNSTFSFSFHESVEEIYLLLLLMVAQKRR